jgi:hypothetical protein
MTTPLSPAYDSRADWKDEHSTAKSGSPQVKEVKFEASTEMNEFSDREDIVYVPVDF